MLNEFMLLDAVCGASAVADVAKVPGHLVTSPERAAHSVCNGRSWRRACGPLGRRLHPLLIFMHWLGAPFAYLAQRSAHCISVFRGVVVLWAHKVPAGSEGLGRENTQDAMRRRKSEP